MKSHYAEEEKQLVWNRPGKKTQVIVSHTPFQTTKGMNE